MSAQERALLALRSLVLFEIAVAGAETTAAMLYSARAERELSVAIRHCESSERAVQALMLRPEVNPALLAASRHLFRAQRTSLQECRAQQNIALEQEERAREELANQRNRERSLERALESERRAQLRKQQVVEFSLADDLWLQQAWAQQTHGRQIPPGCARGGRS
jgi:phage protein D